jgi:predicted transcriptional regulator
MVSDEERALEVVRALSDEYSRKIILSIINQSLPIEEISRQRHIPMSTCYRRVHELLDFGIIRPDKTIIQDDGKKFVCYKSVFKNATIRLDSGELKVDIMSNREVSDKLHDIWISLKSPQFNPEPMQDLVVPGSKPVFSNPQKIGPVIAT